MKEHKGFIDNRKVSDSHQEGIRRVIQKGGIGEGAQGGAMSMKGKGSSESHWKRAGGSLTPRRG